MTSLLLLACYVPALAAATDTRCNRGASLDRIASTDNLPASLQVDIVELISSDDVTAAEDEFTRDNDGRLIGIAPDLSSRARSMAILREIFDEQVGADLLDVGSTSGPLALRDDVLPGTAGAAGPGLRQPAADVAERDLPAQPRVDGNADAPDGDVQFPGISDEDNLRYRRQMYRTDI